ncbi:metallopeptidase family protein [Archangium lansingense]|uniref:Metallopeptidase family protein n=1 Tax=Archangium lansingense TaxID=2995310 RepID=A0ABT4AFX3_9BACT|nr:metallopeptidase family protein [Archangium lansinium]MCY1080578.1 metallopeptidase family protein [Archangium lansinium]
MSRRGPFALCFLLLGACQWTCSTSAPAVPDAGTPAVASAPAPAPVAPVPEPLPPCRARGTSPLSAALDYLDSGKYPEALSCAAQASALEPDSAAAHSARGEALAALQRTAEAQLAYARALALDPGQPDALLGAAHLFAVQLPSSREHDELGALYAERGLSQADMAPELLPRFALVAAMALNDLGQAAEALQRAQIVLAREPDNHEAAYEKALALFELCRFAEARAAFASLVGDSQRGAHAHYHLGLLLEREGKWKQAQVHFDKARVLSPEDFPTPPMPTEAEFREEVARAVSALPEDMRKDLTGVPVRAEELPAEEDLLSGEPPLSPAILGLFRGPPLGEPCDGSETPCRSVALYRLNLARAVRTRDELREQIKVTLLHEVGHLRGEDDLELAARGLE